MSHGTAEPVAAGADRSTGKSGSKSQDKADQESQPTANAEAEAATSAKQAFTKMSLLSRIALNFQWRGIGFAGQRLFDWLFIRAGAVTLRDGRYVLVTSPEHGVSLEAFADHCGCHVSTAKRAAAELKAAGHLESVQRVNGWYWRLSIDQKALTAGERRRLDRKAERFQAQLARSAAVLAGAEPVAATSPDVTPSRSVRKSMRSAKPRSRSRTSTAEPRSHSLQEVEVLPAAPTKVSPVAPTEVSPVAPTEVAPVAPTQVAPVIPPLDRSSQFKTERQNHHHPSSSTSQDAARSPEGGGGGELVEVDEKAGKAVSDLIDRLERIGAEERRGIAEIRTAIQVEIGTFGQAFSVLPEAEWLRLTEAASRIYRQAGDRKGVSVGDVGGRLVSQAGIEPVRKTAEPVEEPTGADRSRQEALQALLNASVRRAVAEDLVAKVSPEAIVAHVADVVAASQVRDPAAVIVARLKAWRPGDPLPAKRREPLPIGCYYDAEGVARTASGARLCRSLADVAG